MDIKDVLKFLKEYDGEEITIMEVCGTHTASIAENAIPSLISDKIKLISGPGCPVCVTVSDYVDRLIELALQGKVIVTFGDMIRVPGSKQALKDIKSQGADIRMVYTPTEIIDFALAEPEKDFVFAAVGFETTTPIYALLIDELIEKYVRNVWILTALKTMPQVIKELCESDSKIDGFLAPGHVAVITGSEAFAPIAERYSKPFAVSGFEAQEILASIYALIKLRGQGKVVNLYKKAVSPSPNDMASEIVGKYFEVCDAAWRGLGIIKGSGLALKKKYSCFDAGSRELINDFSHNSGCSCGEIITGKKRPSQCRLFGSVCTPEHPIGACMVSNEGACFNYITNNRE